MLITENCKTYYTGLDTGIFLLYAVSVLSVVIPAAYLFLPSAKLFTEQWKTDSNVLPMAYHFASSKLIGGPCLYFALWVGQMGKK